jgi:hypothetical protein
MELLRKTPAIKKWQKFMVWSIASLIVLFLTLLLVLELNKENIKQTILTSINEVQSGELLVDDLAFTVFTSFPDLAIVLHEARYYEKKSEYHNTLDPPICRLERLSLGINLLDLLSGKLRISKLELEKGRINTIRYVDSSFNMINALESGVADSVQAGESGTSLDLHISEITLKNIEFSFTDQINGNRTELMIKRFYNGLTIDKDSLILNFNPQIEITGVNNHKILFLSGTTLEMSASLCLNMKTLKGVLNRSRFSVEGANLTLLGSFDLNDDLYVNLEVASNLTDPSLLLLIFQDEVVRQNLKKIRQGASFVSGHIKGKLLQHNPFMELSFGVSGVDMQVPELNFTIKDLNIQGAFSTGVKQDLSDAVFQVTNLSYIGREGKVQSSLQIKNFINPLIKLKIDGTFDLSSTEKIFKFIKTPVYSGLMTADIDLTAELDRKIGKLRSKIRKTALKVRNLSFLMTNNGKVCDDLAADIYLDDEGVTIDSLRLRAGQSDLLLMIQSKNLLNYFLGLKHQIDVHASFSSHVFDFKQFLSKGDVGQWILDEYLHDLSGEIWFHSDSDRLNQQSELPPGTVKIRNLGLIPLHVLSIGVISGTLNISPERLEIQNFKANLGNNDVIFSGEITNYADLFANEYYDSSTVTIDLHSDDLILRDLFTYNNQVYLPEFWVDHHYKNFDLQASLILPAKKDSTRIAPFDLHIDVKRLSGINKKTELVYDNLRFEVTEKGNNLLFANINGRAGNSSFSNSTLNLINISNADSTTRFSGKLTCDRLIIDEWLAHIFYKDSLTQTVASDNAQISEADTAQVYNLPPIDIEADIGLLQYKTNRMHQCKTSILMPETTHLFIDERNGDWWLPDINFTAKISSDTFRTDYFKVPEIMLSSKSENGLLEFTTSYTGILGAKGKALIQMDISKRNHSYWLNYEINDYQIEVLLERLRQKKFLSGKASISMDISLLDENLSKLNGELTISGRNLYIYGIDLDEFLTRYRRTQNFNLMDIGAFMLAGPAGTVLTKASDYAILLQLDPQKKSQIQQFLSSWSIESGRVIARDVALSTDKSRIAMKGGFDLIKSEFIDLTLAVVDEKGCALLSQGITGKFSDPQLSSVNMVGTILGPVTNILKLITGNQCEPFYTGELPPPLQQ